ncbi:ATP cone domain-containing protein, partial [Chloroflexota bacterium]
GKAEIPSAVIGDMVMGRLKRLDYIAYIRFASVYREFTGITALKQEVDTLIGSEAKASLPTSQLPLLPAEELGTGDRRRRSQKRGRLTIRNQSMTSIPSPPIKTPS